MKLIRPTLILLAAVALLAVPSRSEAALSFDLLDGPNYGYDTKSVTSWDGTQAYGFVTPGFSGTATISDPSSATVTQNFSGGASGGYVESWADLVIDNDTTNFSLNEFTLRYNTSNTPGGSIVLYWALGDQTGSALTNFVQVSGNLVNTTQFHFQGEDLYPGLTPPLLAPSSGKGTLRFVLSSSGGPGSSTALTLSNLSITAVVPEPSSALLLTSALGLFGGFFRRRRSLAPVEG